MKAYERLLSYVKVFTPSSEETGTSPSTQYQFDLARLLVQELKELAIGSRIGKPSLAPRIPINAPTEDIASER